MDFIYVLPLSRLAIVWTKRASSDPIIEIKRDVLQLNRILFKSLHKETVKHTDKKIFEWDASGLKVSLVIY